MKPLFPPAVDLSGYMNPSSPAWLRENTVMLTVYGSQAYGTATPESDLDIRGIAIPPLEYWVGYQNRFEQSVFNSPQDTVIFGVEKFFALAADANPSVLEILFTDDSDLLYTSQAGKRIRGIRDLFKSKKVRFSFAGFAHSQLNRVLTHRQWLLFPPTHKPTRQEFGLPETTVLPADQIGAAEALIRSSAMEDAEADAPSVQTEAAPFSKREWLAEKDRKVAEVALSEQGWERAAAKVGFDDNMIEFLRREKAYKSAKTRYDQYETWKRQRNHKRAAVEAEVGYDAKHVSQLVRLLRMCREILETGEVIVKRPDAAELLEIKRGAWSFERVIEWAKTEDAAMNDLYAKSTLPHHVDHKALDAHLRDIVMEHLHLEQRKSA